MCGAGQTLVLVLLTLTISSPARAEHVSLMGWRWGGIDADR